MSGGILEGGAQQAPPAGSEQPPTFPYVRRIAHKRLGALLRMTLSATDFYDLTLEEGRTLSRAMTALAHDWRLNDQIFLSPIACDREFFAAVREAGVFVETPQGERQLSWDDVREVAERLAVE